MSRLRRIAKDEVPSHTFFVYVQLFRQSTNREGDELQTHVYGPYQTQGGAKAAVHTIRRQCRHCSIESIWVQGFKLVQDGPIQEIAP